jgi:hypothetical protein
MIIAPNKQYVKVTKYMDVAVSIAISTYVYNGKLGENVHNSSERNQLSC